MKALISGATRGIGKAIAKNLSEKGYDLILLARNKSDLEKLKEELMPFGNTIQIFSIDLKNDAEYSALATSLSNEESLDVLINNVGIFNTNNADLINPDDLVDLLKINLLAAIKLSNLFIPKMKEKQEGSIINIGSVMGLKAAPFASNYSITKHAFKGWNDALRDELRTDGIKVNAIYPGAVNTSSWDGMNVDRTAMIQPDDIAKIVNTLLDLHDSTLVEDIVLSPLQF
ncbi:MAG: SDR family NAD(P)-dependent oxidoreductase [Bacteroidetes bacterium]|nr:MAG: SDR family NAD(P)-dependent oxidoreductase [Bacteroidota bacterium]MBL1143555.1 SDR family NAD(P)-dependent oxidoreductase [Bacteroidota bacterium]NOG56357.1 SDR family NAD(P)-dependent oxidoreductase [Bacteroidota bacterium]